MLHPPPPKNYKISSAFSYNFISALTFLYWEYQLGILPKGTDYKPTSPFMKEELRKLDTITAQVDYLAKNRIETLDDLLSARETIQSELDTLIDQRTKLQNKIRRASPAEKERLRGEKQAITAQISACRKKLKLNTGVEERSAKIQDTMDMVYTNEEQHRQIGQERTRGARSR